MKNFELSDTSLQNDLLFCASRANMHITKQGGIHYENDNTYNITGKQRKQLAEDISVALNTIPKCLGYPTCNYQIGDCILERDGKLIIPECVADETARVLLEHLRNRGYVGEIVKAEDRLTISVRLYQKSVSG